MAKYRPIKKETIDAMRVSGTGDEGEFILQNLDALGNPTGETHRMSAANFTKKYALVERKPKAEKPASTQKAAANVKK